MNKMLTREQPLRMLLAIFMTFLKIGPSTFGGGYAMIATIEKEVVERKKWMNADEMSDMVSVAGSAPGGVAVNSAAFVGYRMGGVLGAIAAVLGITLPTLAIVLLLSLTYSLFKDYAKVQAALKGIHAAVIALILVAAWKMAKASLFDALTIGIAAIALGILLFTNWSSIWLIIGAPIIGITVILIRHVNQLEVRTEPKSEVSQEAMLPEYYI
ncbi:chromate transporter [Saccharibacillus sp. JS10]|uniref:chromate transporter n=1 Tax=Saccharibacillus sp. JS10 TaxID=2950552 RepID=UPI00210D28EC|nr:chromate transporter [Saccharibacillus sp. JS10]MCQ4086204.1 chromate transporter [Saccharibacillus sp. JS10]